jgi:hypothetical protein
MDPRALETVRDWEWLLKAARAHGVLPRLARIVRDANGATPDPVRRELHARARESATRSLRLTGDLIRILDACAARGIRALAHKGPALALLAYGDLALRPSRDLDILVDPADVPAGRALLEQLGYRPGPLDPPPAQRRAFLACGSECVYTRDDDIVELHWRILPPYFAMRLPFAELWERRAALPLGGRTIPTLSREDLALALCAHGAQHRWERLEWIADVARLLRPATVDWSVAAQRARRLGGARMVGLALRLAADLLDAALPVACASLAVDPAVGRLAVAVRDDLVRHTPPSRATSLTHRAFHVRVHERLRDRVRYVWQVSITPNLLDWALVRLPAPLAPLYYVIRPVRLAVKYARLLFRPAPY